MRQKIWSPLRVQSLRPDQIQTAFLSREEIIEFEKLGAQSPLVQEPLYSSPQPKQVFVQNPLGLLHILSSNKANVTAAYSILVPPPFRGVHATEASSAL